MLSVHLNHKDQCENIDAAVLPEIMEETAADLPLSPKVGTEEPLSTLSFYVKGDTIESSLSFEGETSSMSALFALNYLLFFGVRANTQIVEILSSTTTTAHRIM